jgi:hypothetical protein
MGDLKMASEKRLIDANKWEAFYHELKQSLEVYNPYEDGYEDALDRVDDWMDAQPTVDAVEVVHGRWKEGYLIHPYGCSRCWARRDKISPYCPNCGAKMDG